MLDGNGKGRKKGGVLLFVGGCRGVIEGGILYHQHQCKQYLITINPLTPGHFAKKCLLKRVKPFLGRCLAKKNPNCPKRCLQVEHWTSFCS